MMFSGQVFRWIFRIVFFRIGQYSGNPGRFTSGQIFRFFPKIIFCSSFNAKNALPHFYGIEIALQKLIKMEEIPIGVSSQTVGDISISYARDDTSGGQSGMPPEIARLLAPYIKMRTI